MVSPSDCRFVASRLAAVWEILIVVTHGGAVGEVDRLVIWHEIFESEQILGEWPGMTSPEKIVLHETVTSRDNTVRSEAVHVRTSVRMGSEIVETVILATERKGKDSIAPELVLGFPLEISPAREPTVGHEVAPSPIHPTDFKIVKTGFPLNG